jgi:DNA-binding NtrC family response regulator
VTWDDCALTCTNRRTDRILVVSENPQWLAALRIALSNQGYEPFISITAEEAVQLSSRVNPCVLVVDGCAAETLDGRQLAHSLHALDPHLQCVIICDKNHKHSEQCQEPKEDWIHLCEKPFSMIHFANVLSEATKKS